MKVVLGVTGGIAAYKAIGIARELIKRGDEVRVVMTAGAQEFVQPLTFQVITQNPVGTTLFDATYESEIGHIEIARWADVVVVAPATANSIARMAAGMADDLLTTIITATTAPVVIAPAMNTQMYRHPLVRRNMATLREIGYSLVDPDVGELACKEVGPGRLPDANVILQVIDATKAPQILVDKKILITAGPTREHLDPARFISNPSTGKMGFALAQVARAMGAQVTLVTGPSEQLTPYGVERIDVEEAAEMHKAVMGVAKSMDFIVMAAAVADWRPAAPSPTKRAKSDMSDSIALERTPDILSELGEKFGEGSNPYIIGFAAETHDVEARGQVKLQRKNAHMLVANSIGGENSAFGADGSAAYLIFPDRSVGLEHMPKTELARRIWKEAARSAGRP